MYLGPPFGNLDEDLQVILERYLDERGINTALALFVPDYVDYKEQREYVTWLNGMCFYFSPTYHSSIEKVSVAWIPRS